MSKGANQDKPLITDALGPSKVLPYVQRGRGVSKMSAANDNGADWRSALAQRFARPFRRIVPALFRFGSRLSAVLQRFRAGR